MLTVGFQALVGTIAFVDAISVKVQTLGVEFEREPKTVDYGTVAVFKDLYGNLWDLLEFAADHPMRARLGA